MRLRSRLKIIDRRNDWNEILRIIREARSGPHVTVGIHKDKADKTYNAPRGEDNYGKTVGEIAAYNEYGTDTTPERSFVRAVVDAKGRLIATRARMLMGLVLDRRMTLQRALNNLGQYIKLEMRNRIVNKEIPPPNAPATVRKKSRKTKKVTWLSDTPLLDTKQLLGSIDHEVNMKAGS